ncbi:MAG TPA: hypothetical protein VNI58_07540 [Mariprofundaceae bacterium]|nr:hypothetical protein [Mariprofundaceae bacterium]
MKKSGQISVILNALAFASMLGFAGNTAIAGPSDNSPDPVVTSTLSAMDDSTVDDSAINDVDSVDETADSVDSIDSESPDVAEVEPEVDSSVN